MDYFDQLERINSWLWLGIVEPLPVVVERTVTGSEDYV